MLPPAKAGVGSAVNDATRELGGTLGVAVVGSLFSSVYAASLADGDFGRLPGAALATAQDSVGAAQAISGSQPDLVTAVQDAFIAGLQTSSLVVGLVCLVGAAVAAVALPGRISNPYAEDEEQIGAEQSSPSCERQTLDDSARPGGG